MPLYSDQKAEGEKAARPTSMRVQLPGEGAGWASLHTASVQQPIAAPSSFTRSRLVPASLAMEPPTSVAETSRSDGIPAHFLEGEAAP